jgi:hypothetical protein
MLGWSGKVVQMKAKTYPVLLNQVSSTANRYWMCSSRSKVVHVTRRELERKFEIVFFAENAPIELKSSAEEN